MKTIIYGINGKMGRLLKEHICVDDRFTLVSGIDPIDQTSFSDLRVDADFMNTDIPEVIIDFSHPSQLQTILEFAVSNKVSLVLATTGYSDQQKQEIISASKQIPIFYSENYSYGIHLVRQVLKHLMSLEQNFDIEIIEKHHRLKVDAPSGTAHLLANTIQQQTNDKYQIIYGRHGQGKRQSEIGIHAVRGGSIVGEHSVVFAGQEEVIEINHQAQSKAVFVHGAIKAAWFINKQSPGLYSMDDLTKEG